LLNKLPTDLFLPVLVFYSLGLLAPDRAVDQGRQVGV